MNPKTLKTLEYNKIIDLLALRAVSVSGKALCGELLPDTNMLDIESAQQETTDAVACILRKGSLPLGGIRDIRSQLRRAVAGGMLNIEELLHIGDFLYVCGKINEYGRFDDLSAGDKDFADFESLRPLFDGVSTIRALEDEIKRCILNSQELSDMASSQLAAIRRNIRGASDKVREHLNKIVHSAEYKTMLQDNIVTMRNSRYCLPVKAEYRATFPGMIHDQSSSGATLFMEPNSVVQLNNKIKELLFDEQREIDRILLKLSQLVAEYADTLNISINMLTRLDFIFAKGELSISMNATRPLFCDKINMKKARHPLLPASTVVPTDIYLGEDFNTLLITGPNTGGKTVTLKTVGLLTCMGQAGLHIPAFDNSELAVFDNVFADIGDEQSIEQSLSTFSSHMKNIVEILGVVDQNTLVLLDELGAGTDPTEGAALAIAILDFLHERNVCTVVTTHYSELKMYALSTPGVENAGCEFDVETLRPTYKLLIGIPGKSNAFDISGKLGLPHAIIDRAKSVLSHNDVKFEDIITDLEVSKKTVILEKERAEQYRRESENLRKSLEAKQEKLASQREKILQTAKEEARILLQTAREETDEMYKNFQRQLRAAQGQSDLDKARQSLQGQLGAMEKEIAPTQVKKILKPLPKNIKKGDKVFVHSLNQSAIILDDGVENLDSIFVQAGIMKIKVKITDLSLDGSAKADDKTPNATYSANLGKSKHISPEIDLRGMMVEEGTEKVRKYLDNAYLASLAQVTIIHGKGTGALRKAIHTALKQHQFVKNFRVGSFGEGEDGVTIVEIK
ncbi:MAG: endonuclease MutS2 [Turicibacter sp.]|nr:endonuclease MutS2 [Turicibacter sp.]